MPTYKKIGRDIIVGKGLAAKHWAGAIIFSEAAIYVCPNGSVKSVVAGIDSGAAAAGMLGAIGGAFAASNKRETAGDRWQDHVTSLRDLPADVLGHDDWPLKPKNKAVIVIPKESVVSIHGKGGRIIVEAYGDTFKLGLGLFGRSTVKKVITEMGWQL